MKELKNLLVVGGTGRNVGKTEFVCRLIEKMASQYDIYALKLSAVYPAELEFHGNHSEEQESLFEEKNRDTNKDTSRMLRAGAKKVFYIHANDETIEENINSFLRLIPENALILSESNSLASIIKPGLQVLVHRKGFPVKERARAQVQQAHLLVKSDGESGFPELEQIYFDGESWRIK